MYPKQPIVKSQKVITPKKAETGRPIIYSEIKETKEEHGQDITPDPLANPNSNPMVQNIRLEKEIKRLRRENKRYIQEINKLNDLIEQMKNIDDDELLMIEKIQTKEIYGKAQKLKISEIQKETEKIRIEIDRLKVVNNNKDRILHKKDTEIIQIKEELERVKNQRGKERIVYKTEYKDRPETMSKIRDLEEQLRRVRNTTQVKTVNGNKVYRDNPNSKEMSNLRNIITEKDGVIHQKNLQIGQMQSEIRGLKLNQNSANLTQALNEMQRKAEYEKQRADELNKAMNMKDNQIRNLNGSIRQRDQQIGVLNNQLKNTGDKGEMERLKGILRQRDALIEQESKKNKNLENMNNKLRNDIDRKERDQEMKNKLVDEERQRVMDKLMKEKDNSVNRLLHMKDQQINQMKENLEFFKKEAENFKAEAKGVKDGENHKIQELEKLLEEQNDQMKLMRRDILQMEKVIDDKDEALKKMSEIQYEGEDFKMGIQKKRANDMGNNEYSFGQNQHFQNKSNQFGNGFQGKKTLLSEGKDHY